MNARPFFPIALALACPLLLASASAAPMRNGRDAGDDQYRFLVGLVDKELWDLAAKEGASFLRTYPDHAKAPLARYRLATALFELERQPEAAPYYRELVAREGFEYRAESAFRLGQCELAAGRLDPAREAFALVLAGEQAYLIGPATFLTGETEFRAKRYPEAQALFQKLLSEHADSEYARDAERSLAWCAWEQKQAEDAVTRIRKYLQRYAGEEARREDDELRVLLGEALLELGRPQEALQAYRDAGGGDFADAALRGAGFARAAMGDPAGAAEEFGKLLELHPQSRYGAEARLQSGIQLLAAGRAPEAVQVLQAGDARDPEALYWLGRAQVGAQDRENALRTFDRALALKPEADLGSRLQLARGELLGELGRTGEALAAFESAGSDYALYAAAVTALNEGDDESAARFASSLLSQHPESSYRPQASLVLGEALFAQQNYEEAEKTLLPLIGGADGVDSARALSRVAWCRYLQGDPAGAAARFQELVRLQPSNPGQDAQGLATAGAGAELEEARYMLGRTLAEAGREDEAAQARESYLREHPEGPHAAEVLLAVGRATPGEEGARRLMGLVEQHAASPLVPQALLELGDRLADAGQYAEAEAYYRQLLDAYAAHELAPQARYGLAWCLYERGEFAAAGTELAALGAQGLEAELAASAAELAVWSWSRAEDAAKARVAWDVFARQAGADDARRLRAARAVIGACKKAQAWGEARAVLDQLLSGVRDADVAVSVLVEGAYLELEAGDLDRAQAQVQVARRRSDSAEVKEAAFYVAEGLFAAGNDQRAIELYRAAEGAEQLAPQVLYKLGFALLRTDDLEAAEAAFTTLVAEHENSELRGEGLFLLGETRFRQERWAEAAQALDQLHREQPKHEVMPKALFRLGVALERAEDHVGAERALTELAQGFPQFENRLEAELWRGKALAAQKKTRAARQAFERVVAEDRGELAADARLGLGALLEEEERIEEALSEYLKVAVLYAHEEKVSEALFRAGLCLERLGNVEKAVAQYRELMADHRDSPFARKAQERLETLLER